jgi:hypothetical protein
MNEELLSWLSTTLPFSGLAAWCARLPDRSLANLSYVNWLTKPQLEQALTRLAHSGERLQHLQPQRLCWSFEHLRVYFATRHDGACLALFVENRPESLHEAAEDFIQKFSLSGQQ